MLFFAANFRKIMGRSIPDDVGSVVAQYLRPSRKCLLTGRRDGTVVYETEGPLGDFTRTEFQVCGTEPVWSMQICLETGLIFYGLHGSVLCVAHASQPDVILHQYSLGIDRGIVLCIETKNGIVAFGTCDNVISWSIVDEKPWDQLRFRNVRLGGDDFFSEVRCMSFLSSDDETLFYLVAAGGRGQVFEIRMEISSEEHHCEVVTHSQNRESINSMSYIATEKHIAIGYFGAVSVYSTLTWELIHQFNAFKYNLNFGTGDVWSVCFDSACQRLFTGVRDDNGGFVLVFGIGGLDGIRLRNHGSINDVVYSECFGCFVITTSTGWIMKLNPEATAFQDWRRTSNGIIEKGGYTFRSDAICILPFAKQPSRD